VFSNPLRAKSAAAHESIWCSFAARPFGAPPVSGDLDAERCGASRLRLRVACVSIGAEYSAFRPTDRSGQLQIV
jgi:hypothetical protein